MNGIALFAYNFPHKKTQDFLFRLMVEKIPVQVIFAADAVKLNIPPSSIRTKVKHLGLVHPREVAKSMDIEYINLPHNASEIPEITKSRGVEIGLISGARILKKPVIESFAKGIINFHPGLIPESRGLDAMLWSLLNGIPLGVTSHIIDHRVDAGKLLEIREIDVSGKDTLFDLSEKLQDLQIDMLKSSIQALNQENPAFLDKEITAEYNRKMPAELEQEIVSNFEKYLKIQLSFNE